LMWDRFAGVILTSATLSTLGTFKRFAEQCGLQYQNDVTYLKLRSPFDYQNNAVLEVPAMKNNPSDRGHTNEITQWMNDNIDINKGTLVLFSSYWQMEQVKVKIADKIKRILLVQGDLPKQALLRKHKKSIDKEYGSVLFGVASLAEGVDLKGDYLTHVIIAKLPFSVPDSPIYNATSEWLEANKKNPFMELSVPDASMKLIQGAGRLIRSETDTGKVSILDSRLLTKQYGKKMLDDLPPMKRKLGE
jgi:ATP-dependent DNA helicase DinG